MQIFGLLAAATMAAEPLPVLMRTNGGGSGEGSAAFEMTVTAGAPADIQLEELFMQLGTRSAPHTPSLSLVARR